jgi:hypothetical protein
MVGSHCALLGAEDSLERVVQGILYLYFGKKTPSKPAKESRLFFFFTLALQTSRSLFTALKRRFVSAAPSARGGGPATQAGPLVLAIWGISMGTVVPS